MKIICNARNSKAIPVEDCKPNPEHPACNKCESPNKPRISKIHVAESVMAEKQLPTQKPKSKIIPSSENQHTNAQQDEISYVDITRHPTEPYKAVKFSDLNSFLTGTGMDPGYKSVVTGNEESRRKFEKSKNPYYVLEAFIVAHVHKCYPPVWVMDFINERFEKYYYSAEKSLDELFGFVKAGGKGWTPPRVIRANEERDKFIKREMFVLTAIFKITIGNAAKMVASLIDIKAKEWDEAGLRRLSAETIAEKYRKKWKPFFKINPPEVRLMSIDEIKAYLRDFPPDSFPKNLPYNKIDEFVDREAAKGK